MRTSEEGDYKLKYGSVDPEINAQTFIGSLLGFTTLVQEVNQEFNTGKKIDIRIKALAPGSFIVHLEVVETVIEALKHLFTEPHIKDATEVIAGVSGLLGLRKLLKKETPKSLEQKGQNIIIENSAGSTVTIDQKIVNLYFSNPAISTMLDKTIGPLVDDILVTDFTVSDIEDTPLFYVDRQELSDMIVGKAATPVEKQQTPIQRTTVGIIKPSFDRKYKWEISFFDTKQFAEIADEAFIKRVLAGEQFGCGDHLDVDLQLIQVWDQNLDNFMTKEYRILKVYNHIPRAVQTRIELGDEALPVDKLLRSSLEVAPLIQSSLSKKDE